MKIYLRVLTLILTSFMTISLSSCFNDSNNEDNKAADTNIHDNENKEELVPLTFNSVLSYKVIGLDKYVNESNVSGDNEYLITAKEQNYSLQIKLNNPSKLKITSVTINETTYKDPNLEISEDNQIITIKLKALPTFGIQTNFVSMLTYEFKNEEAILYLNYKYTLNYPHVHEVEIKNLKCDEASSYLDFTFDLVDEDNLLRNFDLSYSLYFEDETRPVKTSKNSLKLGKNSLKLEDLEEFSNYKLEFTYFKNFEEFGGRNISNTFYSKTFKTDKSVELSNFIPTYNSVSFSNYVSKDIEIQAIYLKYKDKDGSILTLENDVTSINNLYANTSYTIQVLYKVNDTFKNKFFDFTTLAYETPTLEVSKLESDLTSVNYELIVSDPDNKGELVVILKKANVEISRLKTKVGTFPNLEYDTTYTLIFIYTYNLLDNLGDKEISVTKQIRTKSPDFSGIDFDASYNNETDVIDYNFSVGERTDVSLTELKLINNEQKEVYKVTNPTLVGSILNEVFNYNTTYKVKARFKITKGEDEFFKEYSKEVIIPKLTLPTVTLNETAYKERIEFNIDVVDPDSICTIKTIKLFDEDKLLDTRRDVTTGSFSNLKSNKTYKLELVYDSKIKEPNKLYVTETITKTVKTLGKEVPTLSLENVIIGSDTFDASLKIVDPDNVYSNSVHNYFKIKNVNDKQDYDSQSTLHFENLRPNATYELTYIYYYDLLEGDGKVTTTFRYTFTTLNKMRINSFTITSPNHQQSNYIFKVDFRNPNYHEIVGFTINGNLFTTGKTFRKSPVEFIITDTSIFKPNSNNVFTITSVTYYSYGERKTLECIGEISSSILIKNLH